MWLFERVNDILKFARARFWFLPVPATPARGVRRWQREFASVPVHEYESIIQNDHTQMGGSSSIIQTSVYVANLLQSLAHPSAQRLISNSPIFPKKEKLTVQDEARLFKSKLGAVRLILRNEASREMFLKLLEASSKQDCALKFSLLDVMKKDVLDKAKSRSLDDEIKDYDVPTHLYSFTTTNPAVKASIETILHPIHQLSHNKHATHRMWLRQISLVQDELLSKVFVEFEQLMVSESFQSARTIDNISRSYSCSMSFADNATTARHSMTFK